MLLVMIMTHVIINIYLRSRQTFGDIGKLIESNLEIGHVGTVNRHNQNVIYLITKKKKTTKSTFPMMEKAMLSLLNKMKELKLFKLGISKNGSELDGHDWSDVKKLIEQVFDGSGIYIKVCDSQVSIKNKS